MQSMSRRDFFGVAAAAGLGAAATAAGVAVAEEAPVQDADPTDPAAIAAHMQRHLNVKDPNDPAILNPDGTINYVKMITDLSIDELNAMLEDEAEVAEDYVAPSGKVIPAVYVRLRNCINRIGIGMGSGVASETAWDVLMNTWSEYEAQCYLEMPLTKWFTAEEYSYISGRPLEECVAVLKELSNRALLWRFNHNGLYVYALMTLMPGFWEAHQMWQVAQGNRERAVEFINEVDACYGNGMQYWPDMYRPLVRVQPPCREVVDGELVPYTDWEKTLRQHATFCVVPCQCRQKKGLLDVRVCSEEEHPTETCLQYGDMAEYYLEIGIGHQLSLDEAIARVRSNVEHGYVIDGEHSKTGGTYCACNCDCCQLLGTIRALPEPPNSLQYQSAYDLAYSTEACIQCGACVDRCPMDSITVGEDGYCVMDGWCLRCGQCAMVCPVDARRLLPRPVSQSLELPESILEDSLAGSYARLVYGRIRDFTGDIDATLLEPEDLYAMAQGQ